MALALVWTFPLAMHLSSHLPGEAGDNIAFLWNFWWMREVLASPDASVFHAVFHSFFHTDRLFAPFGIDLTLHTHTALSAFLGATVLSPLSALEAQNVVLLASLMLNGFAAYLLAFDRTRDRAGALVGGVVFAGSSHVSVHLLGHFNLVAAWGLPLFAMYLLRAIERPPAHAVWSSIAGGLVLSAVAYTDYYYVVYCAALALVLAIWHLQPIALRTQPTPLSPRTRTTLWILLSIVVLSVGTILATGGFLLRLGFIDISARRATNSITLGWIVLAVGSWLRFRPTVTRRHIDRAVLAGLAGRMAPLALVGLAGMAPLLLNGVGLWLGGDYSSPRPSWRSGPGGIDLATLVLGNPLHPIWGSWTRAAYGGLGIDRIEGVGWLGVVSVGLTLLGARSFRRDQEVRRWLTIATVFFVWALGPWLRIGGFNSGLPLPQILFAYIPILSNARMPGRAIVVVFLALGVLAATTIARLEIERRWRVVFAAVALMFMDLVPAPFPLTRIDSPPLYEALRDAGAPGAVCELPLGVRDGLSQLGAFDDRVLVHQMVHGRSIVGGSASRVPASIIGRYQETPVIRSLLALSGGGAVDPLDSALTQQDAAAALRALGIGYFVVNRAASPGALTRYLDTALPIALLKKDGELELYALRARDSTPAP